MAILLNRFILPIGEVASGRVCAMPAKQPCPIKIRYILDFYPQVNSFFLLK